MSSMVPRLIFECSESRRRFTVLGVFLGNARKYVEESDGQSYSSRKSTRRSISIFPVPPTDSPEEFENRSAMALPGKKWNLDAVSRFLGFFSETREETLKIPMVDLVRLAEIPTLLPKGYSRIGINFGPRTDLGKNSIG